MNQNSEDQVAGNGSGTAAPQFLLQQLYVKDMSFEAPNTPSSPPASPISSSI